MTATYRNVGPFIEVDGAMIDILVHSAAQEPKRRSRLNLHNSESDYIQEMIIAFRRDSLNMPHRHPGKSESMHVLVGRVDIVIFDHNGVATKRVRLGADCWSPLPKVFRMAAPLWHTVIPVDDVVVVHETTNGPFVPGQNMEIPSWAPRESDLAVWVDNLRRP